jgi:hypothetical protein
VSADSSGQLRRILKTGKMDERILEQPSALDQALIFPSLGLLVLKPYLCRANGMDFWVSFSASDTHSKIDSTTYAFKIALGKESWTP